VSEIINKVAQSGIITLDLEDLVPERTESHIDIFNQLFQGLILREKDFRAWVKEHDWSLYADHNVALFCSSDAVIPTWAYMLVSSALQPYTKNVFFTNPENLPTLVAERVLASINEEDYTDKRVVIKGCGKRAISNHAYVLLTNKLVRTAKTVMFGEPCSTVPVYKQRK
jgi:hypothetical protein|tara:strand:- start:135 stop:641 length:507 start_codon:yes stop_codon:yes gene_type:complete